MNFDPVVGKLSVLVAGLLVGLVCHAAEPPSPQWSGDENQNLTLRRHRACVENEQYLHQGFCCLNCQAGSFVQKACERDQEHGTCLPCEHGQTYTEHSNGMNRCLPCTHCRSDEIETASCTTTTDTKCQCKQGTFCVPDQACEVCKRCAKCKPGEEELRKCTPFSNTVCRKRDPSPTETSPALSTPTPSSPGDIVIPICIPLVIFLIVVIVLAVWWFGIKQQSCDIPCSKSHCDSSEIVKIPIDESGATAEERQNNQNAGLEGEESRPESRPLLQETQVGITKSPPLEDEDRGLGDSLPNTTSSSQTSLSALPTAASSGNTPHQSPTAFRLLPADMDDPLRHRLLPLQGSEKSLRKSFDLFDEYLDVRIHNKFFRMIGVSDNHIRIAENGATSDKVYELLKNWMQRQGLKADINDLLDALLSMDQRRSAESIASTALQRGYYKHADAP
ncbi:tumor necrosis factor receptor superfamily member 10B-like [Solea senegalensis]|uniref:Tumor necrosis factor receptor superfamily member 10B-like n=1 Tax=Solea senegalensis TaxID=28829 RepID=A0AAV6R0I4_SOLSE|nr:tumor necrosis factor receptor superfamily, member a [Solea senegalensis]KAG7498618.1 tumor necrosis factor receptor superfamily member 10B-like [Solea senegalensis]